MPVPADFNDMSHAILDLNYICTEAVLNISIQEKKNILGKYSKLKSIKTDHIS